MNCCMYDDWGIDKLYECLNHEIEEEEKQHSDWLSKHIVCRESVSYMTKLRDLLVGYDTRSMMANEITLKCSNGLGSFLNRLFDLSVLYFFTKRYMNKNGYHQSYSDALFTLVNTITNS